MTLSGGEYKLKFQNPPPIKKEYLSEPLQIIRDNPNFTEIYNVLFERDTESGYMGTLLKGHVKPINEVR
jgi:hypothetical protein